MSGHPILVIDDDVLIRQAIAEALSDEGYDVREAANGREALELLRAGMRPSLILLDLMMPVMDGWQFRAEQEHDPAISDVPVVAISALAPGHIPSSIGDSIRKPLQLDRLLAVVGKWCGEASA